MPYKDRAKHRAYCREWKNKRRQQWLNENGPCAMCGSDEELEVDHKDCSTKHPKLRRPNSTACLWSWSDKRRKEELKKCQVLCRTCHDKKSAKEREPEHGTHSRYATANYRCRCAACRAAHAETNARYR